MASRACAGPGKACQRGNDEGTTMIAELSNGENQARASRLRSPAMEEDDDACQYGTQPSPHGDNGAGHEAAPPSPNGDNGRPEEGRVGKERRSRGAPDH